MAEGTAFVVAFSGRFAEFGVVVAQCGGSGWLRWAMLGVPNPRDPLETGGGQRDLHYAVSVSGQLVEVRLGRAGEDLPDFDGKLG